MLTQQLRKKANTAQLSTQEKVLYDTLLNLSEVLEEKIVDIGGDLVTPEGRLDEEILVEEASQKYMVYKEYDKVAEYLAELRKQDIIDKEIERRIEQHEERRLRKSHQPQWKPNQ